LALHISKLAIGLVWHLMIQKAFQNIYATFVSLILFDRPMAFLMASGAAGLCSSALAHLAPTVSSYCKTLPAFTLPALVTAEISTL